MHRRYTYLTSMLIMFSTFAWGCRPTETTFSFQQHKHGTVYLQHEVNDEPFIRSRLPEISFNRLQRVKDTSSKNEEKLQNNLNNDRIISTGFKTVKQFSYYTDGRFVIWDGQIIRNPKGTPDVDIASFRAFGHFAADKYSLYFEGKRTDDNTDVKRPNFNQLTETPVEGMVKDSRNLYSLGKWLGSTEGFAIVAQKSRDQRGPLYLRNTCEYIGTYPTDTIVRTAHQIIVNGRVINAEPDSFQIVRWMPGELLVYKDVNGLGRYTMDGYKSVVCDLAFTALEKKIMWRKHINKCQVEEIADVNNPEDFHQINNVVAQYRDRLFTIKYGVNDEQQLESLTLDATNLQMDKRINAGKKHAYFIGIHGVQVMETAGPLVLMDKPDKHGYNFFAHDQKYIYVFDYKDVVHRFISIRPDLAYLKYEYAWEARPLLLTPEGEYDTNAKFTPAK